MNPQPPPRVLVVYASRHGSTRRTAETLARRLEAEGLDVYLAAAAAAPEPGRFDAVVLGSAVYVGRWRGEAVRYLERHAEALAGIPLWLYSSGPTGEGDPVDLLKGWTLPADVRKLAETLRPKGVTVFHGALDPKRLSWLEGRMVRAVHAPMGDYRDPRAEEAWAVGISRVLLAMARREALDPVLA